MIGPTIKHSHPLGDYPADWDNNDELIEDYEPDVDYPDYEQELNTDQECAWDI